jgi:hypothetical protein
MTLSIHNRQIHIRILPVMGMGEHILLIQVPKIGQPRLVIMYIQIIVSHMFLGLD